MPSVRHFWLAAALTFGVLGFPEFALAEDNDEKPQAFDAYGGIDFAPDSVYVYDGVIVSLNGDSSKNGFQFRLSGGLANYQYILDPLSNVEVNGDQWQADAMLGYQLVFENCLTLAAFIGVDYQNVRLTPDDPSNQTRGTEVGFKVAGGLETDDSLPLYIGVDGEYSTAFESYYSSLRLGLRLHKFVFGPEGAVDGTKGYDAQRLGGFAKYSFNLTSTMPLDLTFSLGHQFVNNSDDVSQGQAAGPGGGAGTYGGVSFSTSF